MADMTNTASSSFSRTGDSGTVPTTGGGDDGVTGRFKRGLGVGGGDSTLPKLLREDGGRLAPMC